MAKKKAKKKAAKTVDVAVEDLMIGLRRTAEIQLAIVDLLRKLPDSILKTRIPTRPKTLIPMGISVGDACECEDDLA